jgi:sec-independent protein translocase protein TatB
MLPSLGFQEIVLLGILALIVVGPKDLPLLFRKLGRWTAKLRGMAQEFRSGFDELARQTELDELKREVDALRRSSALPDIRSEISKPLKTLEDYAGVNKPTVPPHDAPAATPPPVPARGPSGPAITQGPSGAEPEAVTDADGDAPEEEPAPETPSNVTPIVRSAP